MKKILNKFIQFSFGQVIVFFLGIITTPIITRLYLPAEMGKYSYFESFSSLMYTILILGLDQSFICYFYTEKEEAQIKLFYKVVIPPILLAIIIGCLFFPFRNVFSFYLVGEGNGIYFIFFLLQVISSILLRFVTSLTRMQQNTLLFSVLLSGQKIVYLMLAILFSLYDTNTYFNLIKAFLFSNIIVILIGNIFTIKKYSQNSQKVKTTYKDLFVFGVPFVFSNALTWVFQSMDKIAIKGFCNYKEVGIYAGAVSIVNLITVFQTSFTTFWIPIAYEHYEKEPENTQFFIRVNEMVSYAMIALATGIVMCRDIIISFLGREYQTAVGVFPFLLLMPIMYTVSETTSLGINFKKKSVFHIYISLLVSVANIIGNLCLVPAMGAKGAAISTGCSYVLFWAFRSLFSYRVYKIKYNLKQFIKGLVLFAGYCTLTFYITGMWVNIIIGVAMLGMETWVYRKALENMMKMFKQLKKTVE